MKARTIWNEKMHFVGEAEGHSVEIDAKPPLGDDRGLTPKALLAIASGSCTAMDVIALLKKFKQPVEALEVQIDAPATETGHPVVFDKVELVFFIKGAVELEKATEAVRLSLTRFCGVNAMLSQAVPIHYKIILNDKPVATGEAEFENKN